MITLTDKGAEKVREFLASQDTEVATAGLRVGVRGGGCSGFQYALAFDQQRDDDEVFEDKGIRLLVDTPPGDWDRVLGVNLKSVYLGARAVIPHMRRLGGGSIVNIASVNGFWVEPALAAYCAAKGGVINLTRAIALENGRYQIRCNCICPGYIDTGMAQRYFEIQDDPEAARAVAGNMHALGRVGKPEDIAEIIA